MLEVDNLHVAYESDVDVVKDVTLRADAGQLVGLIGPNGAGKSTLMRAICQFVPARLGSVRLGGVDGRALRPHELAGHGVGYLMEGHSLFPAMSVEDNLLLGAWSLRHDSRAAKRAVEAALERVPMLAEKRSISAGLLSGGQQRILELERLNLIRPKLVLLDEPSIGLAPKLATEMLHRAAAFRDAGAAVVLIDQNARRIAEIADHVYVMQLGRIRLQGTGRELLPRIDDIVREFI